VPGGQNNPRPAQSEPGWSEHPGRGPGPAPLHRPGTARTPAYGATRISIDPGPSPAPRSAAVQRSIIITGERASRIGDVHQGAAFTELQSCPPGWVKQCNGQSRDAGGWFAALTIGSMPEDPVFAFLTQSGTPIGSPNPLQVSPATPGAAGQLPGRLAKLGIAGGAGRTRSWRQPPPGTGCAGEG